MAWQLREMTSPEGRPIAVVVYEEFYDLEDRVVALLPADEEGKWSERDAAMLRCAPWLLGECKLALRALRGELSEVDRAYVEPGLVRVIEAAEGALEFVRPPLEVE